MSLRPSESYDPWITLKKFATAYGTALIGILIPFSIAFVQEYEWPPELVLWLPIIIAGLIAFENAWEHWND